MYLVVRNLSAAGACHALNGADLIDQHFLNFIWIFHHRSVGAQTPTDR